MKVARAFVVLVVAFVGLFASKTAHAYLDGTNTFAYHYAAGRTVLWEEDQPRCETRAKKCFVLFAASTAPGNHPEARFLPQLSRPTDTRWALGQSAVGTWTVFDLRTEHAVLATADEGEARARFIELAGEAPQMMIAERGAPSRPVLWLTRESLADIAFGWAPMMTILWGVVLFPLYLTGMAAWIAAFAVAFRRHRNGMQEGAIAVAILTAPALPYLLVADYMLLFA